jgi:hypothetical protein
MKDLGLSLDTAITQMEKIDKIDFANDLFWTVVI